MKKKRTKAETKSHFWEKVEHYNARLIPFAIIILLFIVIVELFFKEFAEHYHQPLFVLDNVVIAIFVVDLIFLAIHARSVKFFFKNYWLDLLAVVPFALLFTLFNRIYFTFVAVREISTGQGLLHETLEARKAAIALAKGDRIAKSVRLSTRVLRLMVKSRLFTQVHHKHHLARRKVYQYNPHSARRSVS